jgi:hypothetical protein
LVAGFAQGIRVLPEPAFEDVAFEDAAFEGATLENVRFEGFAATSLLDALAPVLQIGAFPFECPADDWKADISELIPPEIGASAIMSSLPCETGMSSSSFTSTAAASAISDLGWARN